MQTIEERRAYEKKRNQLPHRKAQRKEYQNNTEQGKQAHARAVTKYRSKHSEKYKATTAVGTAIRYGQLVKPKECEGCGEVLPLEGHHEDYSKPLEVVWLCNTCHRISDGGDK